MKDWLKVVENTGKMPKPIKDSQNFRNEKILPFVYEGKEVRPAWQSTGYYQTATGKLRRKDGKKIRKNKHRYTNIEG